MKMKVGSAFMLVAVVCEHKKTEMNCNDDKEEEKVERTAATVHWA